MGEEIGFVRAGLNEPHLFLYNDPINTPELTFTDIAVIQDNWNQLVEMKRQKEIRNPLERFQFCDEKPELPSVIKCPHCGFTGKHEMGPVNKSAICGDCGVPFNIP